MEFRDNCLENLRSMGETSTWVVISDNALLLNYATDKIKNNQKEQDILKKSLSAIPTNLLATPITDMNTEIIEEDSSLSVCTLEEVWKRPGKALNGRWWCLANYDNMSKKDRVNLSNYIKNPCKTGTLVITVSEYKNIFEVKKMRTLSTSQTCHLLNIQYPSRITLSKIVHELFTEQHVKLTQEQINMFIMKMGTAYEDYKDSIDKFISNLSTIITIPETDCIEITIDNFKAASKNIEHFEVNDLLRYITKPINSAKPLNGRRQVHKILKQLLSSLTAKELCNKLKYRVHDMIAYRSAINSGLIPVKIPYSVVQIQDTLEENLLNSRIKKASAYAFKRNTYISSLTSIEDWLYIYLMLENIPKFAKDEQYLAVLLHVVNRTAISNDRLMNNIGIKNTLEEGLVTLNGLMYTNWYKKYTQLKQ